MGAKSIHVSGIVSFARKTKFNVLAGNKFLPVQMLSITTEAASLQATEMKKKKKLQLKGTGAK